ncbi:glycogen debranching protein GlgX [Pseudomonadota bacterium]
MILTGRSSALGATCDVDGVNFALYAGAAEAVELCLFDENRNQVATHFLPDKRDGIWSGYLPGCQAGQRYGYRVHGAWSPEQGLRHNPAKLLIDPWTRRLDGRFSWAPAVFDYQRPAGNGEWLANAADSAPFVPLSVVDPPEGRHVFQRPAVPWPDMILYEANVRGYTMRHPDVPAADRGRLRGLSNGRVLTYLKALGITSLELMPVFAMIDEDFLAKRGLRNLWGYNSIQFFVPDARLAQNDGLAEFRDMVHAIHDAGIEVILDVAYNHSGEGGQQGPSLSFRGIDNLAYYRTEPGAPGQYVNDTGCGNTLDADSPVVQSLVLDSLRFWHREMGVDGFRFDLATVLGRSAQGFDKRHALLARIGSDPGLEGAKMIAEPWDPGAGGYQLSHFPVEWAEWNDRYRDTVRRFWRGDAHQGGEFARRIHGSADLFEASGRHPTASINFVTSHDGFTLRDLVSYKKRHNQANRERNRDGHAHNFSCNFGVEGATVDPVIEARRRQQRLNLLATLLFSHGTPMLLAGDEFGNSQGGNNNAYAQDNETGWVDWSGLDEDPGFTEQVRRLVDLRRSLPLLRQARYIHGRMPTDRGWCDIDWLNPDGRPMQENDWSGAERLTLLFSCHADQKDNSPILEAVAILYNAKPEDAGFVLPSGLPPEWAVGFSSSAEPPALRSDGAWVLAADSLALLTAAPHS